MGFDKRSRNKLSRFILLFGLKLWTLDFVPHVNLDFHNWNFLLAPIIFNPISLSITFSCFSSSTSNIKFFFFPFYHCFLNSSESHYHLSSILNLGFLEFYGFVFKYEFCFFEVLNPDDVFSTILLLLATSRWMVSSMGGSEMSPRMK